MDPLNLVPGIGLLSITAYLALHWRREADWLRRWGATMSKVEDRPWWRRGHFTPTATQSVVLAWLLIIVGALLAIYMVALGLGAI